MDVFKKILTPGKPEDGEPGTPAAPPTQRPAQDTPSTPTRKATCASQDAVVQKEMADLREIKQDSERLCALVEAGLKEGNLTDHTPTLERVAELSNRLLCRNRAREPNPNPNPNPSPDPDADPGPNPNPNQARESAVRFGSALRVTRPGAPTSTLDAAAAAMWVRVRVRGRAGVRARVRVRGRAGVRA